MTHEEALQELSARKAANRKALAEALDRKNSVKDLAGKFGYAAKFAADTKLHKRIIEVIGGMFRK